MSDLHTETYPWKFNISPLSREFEVFMAIYKAQSLSKACEALDSDQGNLSKTLKNLETQLGVKLFIRHRNGVIPTSTAVALHRALGQMGEVWDKAKKGAFENVETQTIRIGAHQVLARTYLPKVFKYINQNHPQVYIELVFASSYEVTRMVQSRELDLGIVVNPVKSEDLVIRQWTKEKIELCAINPHAKDMTLLRNPQMVFIEKLLKKSEFKRVIDVPDYDVAASICIQDEKFCAIVPSTVRERYSKLKSIQELKDEINVRLVTYPGSPTAKWLAAIIKP